MLMEIKFRAYIRKIGEMVDVEQINFSDKTISVGVPGEGYLLVYKFKDINLIQYTCLKDKNGKEIYEGDIVKTNGYKSTALIEFDYLGVTKKVMTPKGERNYRIFSDGEVIKDVLDDVEVIGNIYKSPELLKKVIRWH